MTLDDQIAILQAAKEGKQIQARVKPQVYDRQRKEWYDATSTVEDCVFNFHHYEYRIKPMDVKTKLYLRAPWRGLPPVGTPCNVEATFNPEGELIRVELI